MVRTEGFTTKQNTQMVEMMNLTLIGYWVQISSLGHAGRVLMPRTRSSACEG